MISVKTTQNTSGATNFNVTGNASVGGVSNITSENVTGDETVGGNLLVSGNSSLLGYTNIIGNTSSVSTLKGSTVIDGQLHCDALLPSTTLTDFTATTSDKFVPKAYIDLKAPLLNASMTNLTTSGFKNTGSIYIIDTDFTAGYIQADHLYTPDHLIQLHIQSHYQLPQVMAIHVLFTMLGHQLGRFMAIVLMVHISVI